MASDELKLDHKAVLVTDIKDSSGLTTRLGEDEYRVIKNEAFRIQEELCNKWNGTFIKKNGDGLLLTFDLCTDAVKFALELQLIIRNEDKSWPKLIEKKIGINDGTVEITEEPKDIDGQVVSIAYRLSDMADAGQILCDASVRNSEYLRTKKFCEYDVNWHLHGLSDLKGFEPRLIYQLGFKDISPFELPRKFVRKDYNE